MNGVVVCPQAPAAEAAAAVLEDGGNAVDAAVCGAFSQMVVDPLMCGLGGFGAALYHDARGGQTYALDFSARAGADTRADQWESLALGAAADGYGYLTKDAVNDIGYQAVAVPGVVDALGEMHARWGRGRWSDLLAPAIEQADGGFTVTKSVHESWTMPSWEGRASGPERVTATPNAADLFTDAGTPLPVGAICVQSDHARTLELLASRGARSFYEGEIADAIALDFARNGGHVTRADLERYRTSDVAPVVSGYRGYVVNGAPPPFGGPLVASMLEFLEGSELSASEHGSAPMIRLVVEAAKHAVAKRSEGVDALGPPSAETTQLTIVDGEGSAVVLTHSLGFSSSGVVTPGLGFLFNNYMNCFNPLPGHPDSIEPGKRRAASMAPSLIFDDRGLAIALGAPGASRIAPSVMQVIVNLVDYGMTPVEAVSAPRVDWQTGPVEVEGRIPIGVVTELERLGYVVHRRPENYDPYFARPQLAARRGDRWTGASDPRQDGGVAIAADETSAFERAPLPRSPTGGA